MKIHILSSGSDGNSTLVTSGDTVLMFDAGVPKMSKMDLPWDKIAGIFITHGHSDHISKLPSVLKRCDPIIYMTKEEWWSDRVQRYFFSFNTVPRVVFVEPRSPIQINNMTVLPIIAHHDTVLPVHYVVSDSQCKFFYGCDTVDISTEVFNHMINCNLVMIECNYDEDAFKTDTIDGVPVEYPYPSDLKYRIKYQAHMSIQYIMKYIPFWFTKIIFAHISKTYNSKSTMINHFGMYGNVLIYTKDDYPVELDI